MFFQFIWKTMGTLAFAAFLGYCGYLIWASSDMIAQIIWGQ